MDALQRLLAEAEIRRVVTGLMHAVDRKDWRRIDDFFHEGAHDDHGPCKGPYENWRDWVAVRQENVSSSLHCLSNLLVSFDDDGRRARSETYGTVFQTIKPGADDPLAAGAADSTRGTRLTLGARYVDDFEHREGTGWRIRNRVVVFEWMRTEPDDTVELDPSWRIGRRDLEDAWYAPRPPYAE